MTEISDTIAAIIAADSHGPFPETGQMIRARLRDGQVIDGTVYRVWLDLDTVCIDVRPSCVRLATTASLPFFRVTPAEGDSWELTTTG